MADDWEAVRRIPSDGKIEVAVRDGTRTRGVLVSAGPDTIVLRDKSGERSIGKAEIRRVLVADPSHRARNGAIWTIVGAAAGAGIGFAVCPYCPNEGHGEKYVAPATAVGAGLGALGFLPTPYRTVYKAQ